MMQQQVAMQVSWVFPTTHARLGMVSFLVVIVIWLRSSCKYYFLPLCLLPMLVCLL